MTMIQHLLLVCYTWYMVRDVVPVSWVEYRCFMSWFFAINDNNNCDVNLSTWWVNNGDADEIVC